MNKIIVFIVFVLVTNILLSQSHDIEGQWLMKVVEHHNGSETHYQKVDFKPDGTIFIRGFSIGKWVSIDSQKAIHIDAKTLSGQYALSNQNNHMALNNDVVMVDMQKLKPHDFSNNHKYSAITGLWVLQNTKNLVIIELKLPDILHYTEKEKGMQSNYEGYWHYFSEKTQLFIDDLGIINSGLYDIITVDNQHLSLSSEGRTMNFKRLNKSNDIERLTFTEEDFYDEEGSYLYDEEEQKLPWAQLPIYGIQNTYAGIDKVSYEFKNLIEDTQTFEKKTLIAHLGVNFDNDRLKISFDNIFYGYDRGNLPDDTEMPVNLFNDYYPLFPYSDTDTYRVVGKEVLDTDIGKLDCTVVETIDSFDERVVLWMIDDMPGVLAKVVQDKPEDFGYYRVFKIESIQRTIDD